MNKTLKIAFTNQSISSFLAYLGYRVSSTRKRLKVVQEFEVYLNSQFTFAELAAFHESIESWWAGNSKYLAINSHEIAGLSIRLYKSEFTLKNEKLTAIGESLASVYLRQRDTLSAALKTIKLGNLTNSNFQVLLKAAQHVKAGNNLGIKIVDKQRGTSASGESSVSLRDFLYGEYVETKRYENPKTVMVKVDIISRHFGHLLDSPIGNINADLVRQWMKSKERKLTKRQLAAGDSLWTLSPSTMKEGICTFRACIQLAKEKGLIKDHDLYSLPRIRVDNQVIRYLSDHEELRLYAAINQRNSLKHEQRARTIEHRILRRLETPAHLESCHFVDHVSPFIILFKETGIRPGTLFNSKWSDVDLDSKFFRIRKSIDKRGISNVIPLNSLALETLKEWRKHGIHNESASYFKTRMDAWLFPSPANPELQLTTIKKSWDMIIKEAKIENFRLYDLRHDFASKVMMQTGNIYMVSQLLNHQQIETTKRYAHLMDSSRFEAVNTLDKSRQVGALPDFLK
ncbi:MULTISPECIES: tyrosine-type recombinase/integrase [Shewanella]|uniref:Phage integrase family protein n=2 Tax=Shewanella TaxID=22 RepID=A3D1P2_SHEB5|nr:MULTISPECIES: site-specific integrase [Shewanella]ABN60655.1 phage integrase family protein [Shewanella baltica OS155]AEH13001.1 integrase family protein [Shewanella baltica OS117]AUD59534.1 integrase [Shewanella sp. Pdp11]AVT48732.1 site-specific integrase [Shewanella baltica]MCI2962550.1 site-specific integrase [Shewanella sp. N2AIL]